MKKLFGKFMAWLNDFTKESGEIVEKNPYLRKAFLYKLFPDDIELFPTTKKKKETPKSEE